MYQTYVCSVLLLLSTCLRDLKYFTASTITNIVTAIHKMGTKYSKNVKIPIVLLLCRFLILSRSFSLNLL